MIKDLYRMFCWDSYWNANCKCYLFDVKLEDNTLKENLKYWSIDTTREQAEQEIRDRYLYRTSFVPSIDSEGFTELKRVVAIKFKG